VRYEELVEFCDTDPGKLHVFNTEGGLGTQTTGRHFLLIRFAKRGSHMIR